MLRPYQQAAVDVVYQHLRTRDDNPCVVMPTGAGKSWVIAQIAADATQAWQGRVLIVAHRKELLEQNGDKLQQIGDLDVGVYSAGLGRRDTQHAVIVAGIQSVYRRACDLDAFDLAIVDECHLLPPEGEGMYRQFLTDAKVVNPRLRVIGLTATPFRLKTGLICTPDGFLNHICYEAGVRELIRDGYLCPLITKAGKAQADTSGLHVRAGEFIADELQHLMDTSDLVESACMEIVRLTVDRRSVLIFASGIDHGQHIVNTLQERHGVECGYVVGDTAADARSTAIERFRSGDLKFLCNVDVLTTGFDAPNIDCIAMLRPTMSPGLYSQICGRGFRIHPDKRNCLILDYGGNILRHGPVDSLTIETASTGTGEAPAKECPECSSVIAAGYATCPDCGYQFPPPSKTKHETRASDQDVLSGRVTDEVLDVLDVTYSVHTKRGASDDAPKTMRVDYIFGLNTWQSEWICFEHSGYAREKAIAWWRKRSPDPVPHSAERAVEIAEGGGVAATHKITVRYVHGEKYCSVIDHELGPIPDKLSATLLRFYEEEEIPF